MSAGGKGDYDDRLIDASDALTQAVSDLYDAAEAAQEIAADAVLESASADGPPHERAMLRLHAVSVYLRQTIDEIGARWSDLNRTGQDWTLVYFKPHYYADVVAVDDDLYAELIKEAGL
jgi:hypothetical protein